MSPSKPSRKNPSPAAFGLLSQTAAHDVLLFRDFFARRDQVFARLLGRHARRSPLREELLRLIVLEYVERRTCPVAAYQRKLSYTAPWSAVRSELDLLESAGLVMLQRNNLNKRELHVIPTTLVIEFYEAELPKLANELEGLIAERNRCQAKK